MASAGYLIYCGVMPLLKTYVLSGQCYSPPYQCPLTPTSSFIAIFVGWFLGKKGLFTAEASKGASQVSMNVSLPALIFANVVPAFTSKNVSALGPLFLTAFSYLGFGFVFGYIIREIFYVPRNFWQGIVVLCGMSNWGNLRQCFAEHTSMMSTRAHVFSLANAIVQSVMQEAPFNPDTDPARAS